MKNPPTKYCLLLFFISFICELSAQNLVPNHSFEEYTVCPTSSDAITNTGNWYSLSPTLGIPDFFHECSPSNTSVPVNYGGYQTAKTGVGYVGGNEAGVPTLIREYIQTLLTEPLEAGKCYYLEMNTNMADVSGVAMSHLGMHLSSSPPPITDYNIFLQPTLYFPDVIQDTVNWASLSGIYTALGGERYLTVGNFFAEGLYTQIDLPPIYGAFYYFDDIKVIPLDESQELEVTICEGDCFTFAGTDFCSEGVYTVDVQSPGLCNGTVQLTVLTTEPVEINFETPDPVCDNSVPININVDSNSPEITFEWTGPNNFISYEQNPMVSIPGIYTVQVVGENVCPNEVSIEVLGDLVLPEIDASASSYTIDCNITSSLLTGTSSTPGVSFQWTGPNLNVPLQTAEVYQGGAYNLVVTTPGSCTVSAPVIIEDNTSPPDLFVQYDEIIDCNNPTANLLGITSTSGVNYHWTGPGVDSNLPLVTVSQAGTYQLIVTSSGGCTSMEIVDVMEGIDILDISATVEGQLGCSDSLVTLHGTSLTSGASFQWTGPGINTTEPDTTTDQAGLYTFTVTSPNGCIDSIQVTVEEDTTSVEIEVGINGIINCEDTTVTLTGNTPTPNVSYQWSGPGLLFDSAIVEVSEPGEYILTVMTESECAIDTSIIVQQNIQTPDIIILAPDILNCNQSSTLLDASNSAGSGQLNFEWRDVDGNIIGTDSILNIGTSGTYSLILIDEDNGCSQQSSVDVFENFEEPIAVANTLGFLNCINDTVTLVGSNSSGFGTLIFEWFDSDNSMIGNTEIIEVEIAGTYTLVVTAENGCTHSTEIEVIQNIDTPIADAGPQGFLTCDNAVATLDASNSSGNNLSFEWIDDNNDFVAEEAIVQVVEDGIYTLIVTDGINGCTATASVNVIPDANIPSAIIEPAADLNCLNTEVILDGSNSTTASNNPSFQWLDNLGAPFSIGETITVSTPGVYTLVVTDNENACTHSTVIEIFQNIDAPIADAGPQGFLTCDNAVATLDGSNSSGNNLSFEWIDDNNDFVAEEAIVQVAEDGTYTLIVTDGINGCTATASVNVIPDANIPSAIIEPALDLNCLNTEVILDGSNSTTASNNLSFQWLDNLGTPFSVDQSITVSDPGFYTLVVTDNENACTHSSLIEVFQNIDDPIADAGPQGFLTCDNALATLDGSNSSGNNLSFEWIDDNNDFVAEEAIVQVVEDGTYTLIVTDGINGCTATASVNVIPDANIPSAIIEPALDLNCLNAEVILDGSNSTTSSNSTSFQWLDNLGAPFSIGETITVSTPGVYTLVITDNENACTHSTVIEIFQNIDAPIADAGPQGFLTCDNAVATLDASNSSGNNLSFEWIDDNNDFVADEAIVQVAEDGIYTLIVTDGINGCTATASVSVIPDANIPSAIIEPASDLNCLNAEVILDGSNSTTSSNNTSFQWLDNLGTPFSIDESITVSDSGFYTLVVTDNENACTHSSLIEVFQNIDDPIADAGPQGFLTCDNAVATLDGSNSSGNNLSFEWIDDNNDFVGEEAIVQVAEDGIYTLIVTDGINGCTATASVSVIPDANIPSAIIEPALDLNCLNTEVILDGSNSTTSSNSTSFQWLDNLGAPFSIGETITVSTPGVYTLVITDNENACTHSTLIEVLQNIEAPIADAGPQGLLTCDNALATLDGSNSSGNNLSFEWIDDNNDFVADEAIVQVVEDGIYTLIVTDGINGCTATASVNVIPDANIPSAIIEPAPDLNCLNTEVILDGSNSTTASNNTSFQWLDNFGTPFSIDESITVSDPGFYTLVITDNENACTHSSIIEIFQNIDDPIADAGPQGFLTCDNALATLDGSNSSGNNLSFEWIDDNNDFVAEEAIVQVAEDGIYTLIVTDGINGCTATASVNVIPDANIPTAIIEPASDLNCLVTEIILDGSNSTTASSNTSFQWLDNMGTPFSIEQSITVSDPGFYTLVVTDNENACTHSSIIEIFQNIDTPIADAGPQGFLTCDNAVATLDGSNSSGNNLSFEWIDDNNDFVAEEAIVQVVEDGIYTLIITDGINGCTATASVSVIPDANIPSAIIEPALDLNCLNAEVILDGSNSTTSSNNTSFQWLDNLGTPFSMDESITVSTPGVYTLVVTDNENACTHSTVIEIFQNIDAPIADAGPQGFLTCDNAVATLDGSNSSGNNLSFEWLDDNNDFVADEAIVPIAEDGTYTLIVTDGINGCTATASVSVIPDANIPVAFIEAAPDLNCLNTEVTLDGSNSTSASNNTSFQWLDNLGTPFSMDQSISVSTPGLYTLMVTDNENGCTHSSEVEVIQNIETPVVLIDNTGPLSFDCNTSNLVLDASASSPFGNIAFEWSTIDGNILSDGDSPNPEINQAGVYLLTITNLSNFCTTTDSIIIGEDTSTPSASIATPQTLTCLITETTLDAAGSSTNGDFSYTWTSIPIGGITSGGNTLAPTINEPGIYTLTVLNNQNGCSTESTINVNQDINPPIAMTSVDNQFDCLTESITLNGAGSSQGLEFVYQWTGAGIIDNNASLMPTVYQAGDYQLLVSNQQNGCTASSLLSVLENTNEPIGFNYEILPPDCFGNQGSIEIISVDGGETPYLYSIDSGENFSLTPSFSLDPGNYAMLLQDANGCEYEEIITIPVLNEIEVNLASEVLLNLGDHYEMNPQINFPITEIDAIIWSPSEGLSCLDCLNPELNAITESVDYSLTIITLNGCQTTADITLNLEKTRAIFIPNIFTPNNADGINDVFMIFGNNDQIKEINTFQIFDRWGEVVFQANHFQANDSSKGWKGTFKNEALNSGVFIYFAEIEFIDGVKKIYSGDVTLVE